MRFRVRVIPFLLTFIYMLGACPSSAATRLGVVNFLNKSGLTGISTAQLQQASDILAELLSSSDGLEIVDRKKMAAGASQTSSQNLDNNPNAVDIGRNAQCNYIVIGSITKLIYGSANKSHSSGGFLFFNTRRRSEHTSMYTIAIDARVIDVANGSVVLSIARDGTGILTESFHSGDSTNFLRGEYALNTIWKEAVTKAGAQIAEEIREKFAGETSTISDIGGKSIVINRGLRDGVVSGDIFKVFAEGDDVYDLNGSSLGSEVIDLALLMVTNAQDSSCTAETVAGDISSIRIHDRVRLVSPNMAEQMIESKSLPSFRPLNVPESPKTVVIKRTGLENHSTEPEKVIASYGLPTGEANMLRLAHINAGRLNDKTIAIAKYAEMFSVYPGDYLAAFRAAELCNAIQNSEEARMWLDRVFSINPTYEPAMLLRERIK